MPLPVVAEKMEHFQPMEEEGNDDLFLGCGAFIAFA
jgi:hypothetical protein